MAQVALRKPIAPTTYQLPSDRESIIDGKDVAIIRGLVASPSEQDRLHPLIEGCRSYFKYVGSKLPQVNDFFLWWTIMLNS